MEPEGALRMFKRSETLHNLRYTELYGDGDSKSHSQVKIVYNEQDIEVVRPCPKKSWYCTQKSEERNTWSWRQGAIN